MVTMCIPGTLGSYASYMGLIGNVYKKSKFNNESW